MWVWVREGNGPPVYEIRKLQEPFVLEHVSVGRKKSVIVIVVGVEGLESVVPVVVIVV